MLNINKQRLFSAAEGDQETMNNRLNARVASVSLPPKVQKVANYVMENLQECCFLSSTELADRLEVSYSSVIRLTKLLGFTGYSEFQNFLREVYGETQEILSDSVMIPVERLDQIIQQGRTSPVQDLVAAHVLSNIQSTLVNNPVSQFEAACEIILNSQCKYILANRGCHCISAFLNVILRQMLSHVYQFAANGQNIFDFVSDLGPEDCAIVISFPRYSSLTIKAAEMAKEQGAKIILLTNQATSPLAPIADVLLLARCQSSDYYNSYVAALMAAELLCAHLSRMTHYSNREVLQRIDEYTSQFGDF